MDPLHNCLKEVKRELDYLRWFYTTFIPKMEDAVKQQYTDETGEEVPDGY